MPDGRESETATVRCNRFAALLGSESVITFAVSASDANSLILALCFGSRLRDFSRGIN